jgi:hypothetical protein
MGVSSQALGLGTHEETKLRTLLNNANPARSRQLERAMERAVSDAIKEPDLTAQNVQGKIAKHLKIQIPELTQP